MTPPHIAAVPLERAGVRLEPLEEAHRAGLAAAGAATEIWRFLPYDGTGPGFDAWFDWSVSLNREDKETVWAVRKAADGEIVGTTRYLNIAAHDRRVEIGSTWYAPAVWGSHVNPACKRMLLAHGFETLKLNRIELKTDLRNLRSQAAIAKLGAVREGVFRRHMVLPDGHVRDTVYFSIIREEWPEVRARLDERLASA
ncbi:GNAT family protein [Parvibaculum sp.]|uniref:GNAT family N-acetyltransferase n=1 Tax=Parvibaculum sp. TaxID=2024848 RepID=UPI001B0C8E27|nr:GNAT family protein [Parvibaculum sp.]MBO6634473.1 GNAT family N-acetyltransferase [Parvibaculum sp.]MBO6678780.1 GNAT family N-acetyltransferase [Parvibaculum sp.]MBO6686226.1 GNAT family N-acetyltransferase [Parvibaculum sp.]MBO6905725.1 GNAT family N-acetyltransferase [Parvibaculum sp.]